MSKIKTWMPVYIGDYLSDTMRLSTQQHGAYFLIMMEYWRQGPLPDDMDELAAIVRADRKTWDKSIWPTIKRFFFKGEDGFCHQKRIDKELEHAQSVSNKRRDAVLQRRDRSSTKDKQNTYKSSTNEGTNVPDLNIQNAYKEGDTCASRASASPSQSHNSSLRSELERGSPSAQNAQDKKSSAGTRLPDEWVPDEQLSEYAASMGLNVAAVAERFCDYWRGVAGAKGRKADWSATWRNWCRRERDWPQGGPKKSDRADQVRETWANIPHVPGT